MTEQEKESLYADVMKRANQKDTFGVENGMRIVAMGEGWAVGSCTPRCGTATPWASYTAACTAP